MRIPCFILIALLAVPVLAQPTAREWNQQVTAGWNLGNQLECQPPGADNESTSITCPSNHLQAETSWGNPVVTQQMLQAVKNAGFNAVRIPVRWQHHIDNVSTMSINTDWLQRVKEVVGYALDLGLKVIINTHHEKWLESRPTYYYQEENNNHLRLLWIQIAEAFKDYDYQLAFAGTNEVHVQDLWTAPTAENLTVQNTYNQTFVEAVRATGGNNAKRHLIVQTYACNPAYGLQNQGFVIPTDSEGNGNNYMSVEVHYYTPWDYCGGGNIYYWGEAYQKYGNISGIELTMRQDLDSWVSAWSQQGMGIVIGEWGVSDHYLNTYKDRIHENMAYYCQTLVSEARQRGIATFVWDNNAFGNGEEKFGIFNRHSNMSLKASWILQGIQQGVATHLPQQLIQQQHAVPIRKVLDNGRLIIQKGHKTYTLSGVEI